MLPVSDALVTFLLMLEVETALKQQNIHRRIDIYLLWLIACKGFHRHLLSIFLTTLRRQRRWHRLELEDSSHICHIATRWWMLQSTTTGNGEKYRSNTLRKHYCC